MAATPPSTVPSNSSASLYVGDLNPDVSEATLYELFKEVGPIMSIRVCRDAITRRSLGYAYVNFQSTQDAMRCLETMNFTSIRNKPCRIMWSQRNPQLRKSNLGNIYIKNLDPSIDNKALLDTFSAFGNILSCKVPCDKKGDALGYGFVHFETVEAANTAIEKVNGMQLKNRIVTVAAYHRPTVQHLKENFMNIYVKNLKRSMGEDEVKPIFEELGPLESFRLCLKDGVSTGVAFVKFQDHETAVKAIEKYHDTKALTEGDPSKPLYVARHQTKRERQMLRAQIRREKFIQLSKFVNLYVKNFDDTVDDKQLRDIFEPFGKLASVRVMRDRDTNLTRGFGFVSFCEPDAAKKAMDELMNKTGVLGAKPLYVSLAQPKDERRMQIASILQQRDSYFAPGGANPTAGGGSGSGVLGGGGGGAGAGGGGFAGAGAGAGAPYFQQQHQQQHLHHHQQQQQQPPLPYGGVNPAAAAAAAFYGGGGGFQNPAAFAAAQQAKADVAAQYGGYGAYGLGQPQQPQGGGFPPAAATMGYAAAAGLGLPGAMAASAAAALAGGRGMTQPPRWAQQQQQFAMAAAAGGRPMPPMAPMGQQQMQMMPTQPGNPRAPMGVRGGLQPMRGSGVPGAGMGGASRGPYPYASRPPGTGAAGGAPSAAGATGGRPPMPPQPNNSAAAGGAASGGASIPAQDSDVSRAPATEEDIQNQLGSQLYAQIQPVHPKLAAKITGMILEMDRREIVNLLQNPTLLEAKVGEAVAVLKNHPDDVANE